MRIAYLLNSLGIGGTEREAISLAERMTGRGHTVAIMTLMAREAEEWQTTLPCVPLDMRKSPLSALAGYARGQRFLGQFKPDLVHSHGFYSNVAARLLRVVGPVPVVSSVHNVYEGGWLRMTVYRVTDPLCRCTTAVSEAARERFVRLKAVPGGKCRVITNGIEVEEFVPDRGRRATTRGELGIGDEFLWVAAGRIAPGKDYPNLLRAFAQVRKAHPNVRLCVAGAAFGDYGTVFALATELELNESVRWLGLRRDMAALLDAADGFVLSSAWEGMPLALGEAMAMEKPVVATNVGGVCELIRDAGVTVAAKDSTALAEAMLAMMRREPEERARLGRAARERIGAHFSMDSRTDEWEALYEAIARGR